MTNPDTRTEHPLVIRREAGLPWQWLLAGTIVVAAGLMLGLPLIAQPRARVVPTAGVTRAVIPEPAGPVVPTAVAQARAAPAATDVERIEVDAARAMLDEPGVLVIDARDRQSFAESHLPGAINVTPLDAPAYARRADLSRPILVYCE